MRDIYYQIYYTLIDQMQHPVDLSVIFFIMIFYFSLQARLRSYLAALLHSLSAPLNSQHGQFKEGGIKGQEEKEQVSLSLEER